MREFPRVAAIEAGGTKFVVSAGDDWTSPDCHTIPTSSPEETLAHTLSVLRKAFEQAPFAAIGVASFGPIGIQPGSADYGVIGATPKPGWSGFSFIEALKEFDVPIIIDSDVNGAALAEHQFGAGRDLARVCYVTIGTGIGGGIIIDGEVSNGKSHPELGHMLLAKHPDDLPEAGYCPFHGACLEGLAAGPSIMKRWGKNLSQLPSDHIAHEIEAHYLASLCLNLLLTIVPDRILLGGSVAQTPGLIDKVRVRTRQLLGGYLPDIDSSEAMASLIQLPELAPLSGLAGAYALARTATPATPTRE